MIYEHPHRRFNPLTREWLLVSPHRTNRPWQGQVEKTPSQNLPEYDATCYLCPTNERSGGVKNADYPETFVFDNDFAALYQDVETTELAENDLLIAQSERGICRVVCFSPNHSLTLAKMQTNEIKRVVDVWQSQTADLSSDNFIKSIQIFENRGEMMGCSNPHPHGQIWASETIPNELEKELNSFEHYQAKHGNCLLCDYVKLEIEKNERLVYENDNFAVIVPFWAIYPFETMVLPKRHFGSFLELSETEKTDLADALREITSRYDLLFNVSFPYSLGFHQSPCNVVNNRDMHFHGHFYPPLLRSATVRKFLVGFEILGSPQRDITPEFAAERLRSR
ncbi:MAG: UDP-glucose--hexose-1-phosphate uridylyltransferase [Acidobacteriota bacterium]